MLEISSFPCLNPVGPDHHRPIARDARRASGRHKDGCAGTRVISGSAHGSDRDAALGKARGDVEKMFSRVHDMVTTGKVEGDVGKLAVFAGVHKYPARVKCALLPWTTLRETVQLYRRRDPAPADGHETLVLDCADAP